MFVYTKVLLSVCLFISLVDGERVYNVVQISEEVLGLGGVSEEEGEVGGDYGGDYFVIFLIIQRRGDGKCVGSICMCLVSF